MAPTCSGSSCYKIAINDLGGARWRLSRNSYGNNERATLLLHGPGTVSFNSFHTEWCAFSWCDYLDFWGTPGLLETPCK